MSDFDHTVTPDGYSNLYGYGIPDLNKALGLNINRDDLQKLKESEYNNNVSLNALNALEAWKAGYTGKGVKIGIFDSDSGFDSDALSHEFSNVELFSPELVDDGDHGFVVAQYIVAKNHLPESLGGSGEKSEIGSDTQRDVTGVAFDSELYVAAADLHLIGVHDDDLTAPQFQWFADNGIDVINWSGSQRSITDEDHYNALKIAHENGIIVIIAAGNNGLGMDARRQGNNTLDFAREFDNIIIVSALMPNHPLELYGFSNNAGDLEHNHFAIVEDYSNAYFPSGEYEKNVFGTSLAAPYLAGAVSLIIQKLRDEGKYDFEGDYKQVVELLKNSASFEIDAPQPVVETITLSSGSTMVFNAVHDHDGQYVKLIVDENEPIVSFSVEDINRDTNSFEIEMQAKRLWILNFDGEVHLPGNLVLKQENDPVIEDAIEIIYTINPNLLENVGSPESETVALIGQTVSLLKNTHDVHVEIANILYDGNVKKLLQHQVNVVYGISPEESDQIIDDMILSGKFTESSLFNFITDSATVEAEIDSGNLGSFGDSSWVLYQDFDM
ncbi:MAG: S8 family serine peptidase [Gammaproteobacteria bacterium]|nr:S8 family serine peptidase [Gammaproteobacteria bacterium]